MCGSWVWSPRLQNFDPRAKIIKEICHQILDSYGHDPRLDLAMRLEEIALNDDYFVERKLYPNVDFYSGIIYSALQIPVEMFTVMFAIARTAGWITHWMEMITEKIRKSADRDNCISAKTPRRGIAARSQISQPLAIRDQKGDLKSPFC